MEDINWKIGEEFLSELFKNTHGFIEFRFIKDSSLKCRKFYRLTEGINWHEVKHLNKSGCNVYYGVCPREGWFGTKESIKQVSALWCDVDGKDFFPEDLQKGKQMAMESIIYKIPPEIAPSVWVDSGNGYHCYWLLDAVHHEGMKDIEGILLGIAEVIGGDHVYDLSRLLRLPGTMNTKNPNRLIECKLIKADYQKRYPLAVFKKYCRPTKSLPSEKILFSNSVQPVNLSALKTTESLKEMIINGQTPLNRYRSRSEADFAVILALLSAGHTPDEIKSIYTNMDLRIGDKYRAMSYPDRYLQTTVQAAQSVLNERKERVSKRAGEKQSIENFMLERYE